MGTAESKPTADSQKFSRKTGALTLVLLVCPAIAYLPALDGDFHFDDQRFLETTEDGLTGEALRSPRVVVHLTMFLNRQLFGSTPASFLAVNLLIHAANGVLLYFLLASIPEIRHRDLTLAFPVALVWAVHPLNTQAVAYISQRCESLMATFYLVLILCHTKNATSNLPGWRYAAWLSFWVGALCKQPIWLAPITLLFWDWLVLRINVIDIRNRWQIYAGYVAPAVVLTLVFVPRLVANDSTVGGSDDVSPYSYLVTQGEVLAQYMKLVAYPHPLCFDYDWSLSKSLSAVFPQALVTVTAFVATSILTCFRNPLAFVGIWFFLILAPTSSVLPIADAAAEHRMYLPSAGIIFLAIFGTNWLATRIRIHRHAVIVCWTLTAVVAARATYNRTQVYQDDLRLWDSVIETAPHNGRAYVNVIHLHKKNGDYRKMLQTAKNFHANHSANASETVLAALGDTFSSERIVDAAIHQADEMDRSLTSEIDLHELLATASEQVGRWDRAAIHSAAVVKARPEDVQSRTSLAYSLAALGHYRKAEQQLWAAAKLQPGNVEIRYNIGAMAAAQGASERAIREFQKALKLDPEYESATAAIQRLEAERREQPTTLRDKHP